MGYIDQRLHDYRLRGMDNFDPPLMTTEVVGTGGSTSYSYVATFTSIVGETTPSAIMTVTDGNATLTGSNYVLLTVSEVPAGATAVNYYKLSGGQYKFLGTADVSPWQVMDIGQAVTTVVAPTTNTSGRPQWRAIGFHAGRRAQRQEMMDLEWLMLRGDRDLGSVIHKNGDVIRGCSEQFVSGTTWKFTEGVIYLDGQHVAVPEGQVVLTGSGKEIVGLSIVPALVTHATDMYLKNMDERVDVVYCNPGADRIVYQIEWVVDEAGQINMREFLDNAPLVKIFPTETTEMLRAVERRTYDVSGDFVVTNFPIAIRDNEDDDPDLMSCFINRGKAYVSGREIETIATQVLDVPRARVTESVNNAVLEAFDATGGYTIGTTTENFNVDGLKVKLTVGSGSSHEVTFSGNGKTAAQVAAAINAAVNAYPTDGVLHPLVQCAASGTHVMIRACDGKNLMIEAVSSDAYTVLGVSTGTYYVTGQRIYQMDDNFIKQISDTNYITERIESVVRDGGHDTDDLDYAAVTLLGASDTAAKCHDGNYDWLYLTDFKRTGGDIDWSLGGSDPGNGATYYLKYRYSHNPTLGVRTRVLVTDATIVKGAEDGSDTLVFTGGTAEEVISGNPVLGLSGNVSDAIRILRVNDSAEQSATQYTSHSLTKNSSANPEIELGVSKINWSAAGAQGVRPGGQPTTSATYYVTFEYWKHTVEGDCIAASSYPNDYGEIELAPDGDTYLRDCLDFRRLGATGDTAKILPAPDESARLDYDYYLSRIDKIAMGSDGFFVRLPGTPAKLPFSPKSQYGTLQVSQLHIPPYTYTPSDVLIQPLEIQRKTQWSINEMQAQIERLQYQAALTAEQQTAVTNPAAAQAKGIFTDSLAGFGRSDVHFDTNGVTFTAAVDCSEQCVRLPVSEDGQTIAVDMVSSTNIARVGHVILFDYEPYTYALQNKATTILNCNPNMLYGWYGTMTVTPCSDFWRDITQAPSVTSYTGNQNVPINGAYNAAVDYGAWRLTVDNTGDLPSHITLPPGMTIAQVHLGQATEEWNWWAPGSINPALAGRQPNAVRERTITSYSTVASTQLIDLGERLIDTTVMPYCRTKLPSGEPFYINLSVTGVLPDRDMVCSIGGINADLLPVAPSVEGVSTYKGKTSTYSGSAGKFTARFAMPSGVLVGTQPIKVFDTLDPGLTYATGTFTSQGFLDIYQRSFQSVTTYNTVAQTSTETAYHYGDPLAQTFFVESGTVWLSGVKLYFQSKDTNLPIKVEVRETLNGYPTKKTLQSCTLYPDDVAISDDASLATTFTFADVVGYSAGEFCLVISTNCTTYNIWIAKMGKTDINTNTLVRGQPTNGVLFTSPNDSYWEGHAEWDLTYELLGSNFENNAQIHFENVSGLQASALVVAITHLIPPGCNLYWFYSTDNGVNYKPFLPGIDTELAAIATQVKIRCDVTGTGATFQILESGAGIIALLNEETADYISTNAEFDDNCTEVVIVADLSTDGVNGSGTRSITPYYSIDNGEIWVSVAPETGFAPLNIGDGTYREYTFKTRGEKTITGATNATPIVVTSANHEYEENTVVLITGVTTNTNANGIRRIVNVTDNTFELVDPTTGANIAGNGAYGGGGTFTVNPFTQCRLRFYLETSNRLLTPKVQRIRGICS